MDERLDLDTETQLLIQTINSKHQQLKDILKRIDEIRSIEKNQEVYLPEWKKRIEEHKEIENSMIKPLHELGMKIGYKKSLEYITTRNQTHLSFLLFGSMIRLETIIEDKIE